MIEKHYLFIVLFVALTGGCQSSPTEKDFQHFLKTKKLESATLNTIDYSIQSWIPKKPTPNVTLRIYIEGDGKAWVRSGRPSTDPTPKNRLLQRLMTRDPKPDIAYLARPCQFISSPKCSTYTWTFGRYDHDIIASMNSAVTQLKNQGQYKNIELIGYSGGATIALLLASRRQDISNIRTIAGNLDPEFTNRYHKVNAMPSALNPIDFKTSLSTIPQIHFYGTEDSIIPKDISSHYQNQFHDSSCISIQPVEKAKHHEGWEENWETLLQINTLCRTKKSPSGLSEGL